MSEIPDAAAVAGTAVVRTSGSRFVRLTRDSMLYASGAVVGKALGLAMLPVLTRALTPQEFGSFDVLSTLGSALITMLFLGTDVAAIRLYFDRATPGSRAELLTSWYALAASITIPVGLLIVAGRGWISERLFDSTELENAVALVAVIVVAGTFQVLALGVLRARGSSGQFGLLSSMSLVLNAVLTILLLLVWRRDATAALAALAISWTIGAIVGLAIVRRDLHGWPSRSAARQLLALGLPIAPAVIVVWAADFFQRTILLHAAGAQEVGYFAVAIRFGSVATLMVYGFQAAWQRQVFAAGPGGERATEFGAARWILTSVAVGAAGIGLIARPLVHITAGSAYDAAVPATGAALLAAIALAAFMIASTPLLVVKRTSAVAVATVIGTASALGLNILIAPHFGAIGTTLSVGLGQVVGTVLAWSLTATADRVPGLGRSAAVILASIAVIVAGTMLSGEYQVAAMIATSLVLLALLLVDGSLTRMILVVKSLVPRAVGGPRA